MTTALIITTYNWKEALEISLLSVLKQKELPDEIIVADDGSRQDTRETIEKISNKSRVPLQHIWQEDRGFRAAAIRNKAIARVKSEYIVLVDGDMILHSDFIKDHKSIATENCFRQGSRVLLTKGKTSQALRQGKLGFSPLELGLQNRVNSIHSEFLSKLFSRRQTDLGGIRTCNFAFWRSDCLAVNGFNEDFVGWGREDSEFAARLLQNGIARGNVKFKAIAYHLFHHERPRKNLARNDEILEKTITRKLTYCNNGINKYMGE